MKKQIVTACALIASVAAFATSVESSNTFGVLKIDVGATTTEVVIPVPWAAVGTEDAAIKVTDFVLATGRASGDALYIYDASAKGYKVWQADGNGNWEPENTVVISGDEISRLNATAADTIARGQAAILVLKAAGANNKPVYLSGQYSDATATTTVYGLTAEEAKFAHLGKTHSTLIAPPKAAPCDLNKDLIYEKADGVSMDGDQILVFGGDSYTYGDVNGENMWYKLGAGRPPERITTGVEIPIGTGAWYIRRNTDNITIKWK